MEFPSARPQAAGTRAPGWRWPGSSYAYDCLLVVFSCAKPAGFRDPDSAPRHVLATTLNPAPSRAPFKETCDSEVSSAAAESPMNHEFLHDAEGSPCQFRRCEKGFARSGLVTLPILLITLSRHSRK